MAYSALAHVTTGDLWTAAQHNTYISDNFAAGVPDIFTNAGDMAYATAADVATRLAIGASATVLRSTGSAPAWSNIAVPQMVRMTSQQDFTTTTTLANVTQLVQAIGASEIWMVKYILALGGAGTGGFKFAVTVPSGATLNFGGVWFFTAGTSTAVSGQTTTSGTAIATSNTASPATYGHLTAVVVNSTNAGNIQLQAAQNSSSGTTSILANSIQIGYRLS